jgi:phage/plasmid-associated DNA primase
MEVFSTRGAGAHPTDLAMLAGSRMVTASETDGARWNDKRIKHLTGGDPITARFLYKPFFTYQPEFKILMVGNHQPSLHNVDDAMQRRIVIVPFTHKPRTVDPNLTEKLKAEGPAILAWAIQGCKKWRDRRASGGLPRPARVRASTADYFEEQDTVRQWVDECCTTGDPEHRAVTADLYRYWKMFCEGRGFDPGTSTSLSRALVRLGFEKWRSRNQKGFKGISLLATTTEEKWHTQPLDNTENLTGGATFNSKNGKSLVDKGFSPVTPLEPVHIEVFENAEKKRHPAPKAAPEPDATTPPTPKYTAEQQAAYDRMMGDLNKQIKGGQK